MHEDRGFPKLGVPFLGVPIIRNIVFWGLHKGPGIGEVPMFAAGLLPAASYVSHPWQQLDTAPAIHGILDFQTAHEL